ncbi:hypothetical protein EVAR_35532_1 [Eumeta japonica]|uniref:Uncharacterized protein n=1 Tax=Eumeta variegata TaxID=151549 RepID=A0A4C1X6G2_EUMVA|nr:hypothetical protein EVAR_35532_1 [Eumeta japonica]
MACIFPYCAPLPSHIVFPIHPQLATDFSRTLRPRRYTIVNRVRRKDGGHSKDIEVLQDREIWLKERSYRTNTTSLAIKGHSKTVLPMDGRITATGKMLVCCRTTSSASALLYADFGYRRVSPHFGCFFTGFGERISSGVVGKSWTAFSGDQDFLFQSSFIMAVGVQLRRMHQSR